MIVQYGDNAKNGSHYSSNTNSNELLKLSIVFIGPPFLISNLSDLSKTYQRRMIKEEEKSHFWYIFGHVFGIPISNIKSSLLSIFFRCLSDV